MVMQTKLIVVGSCCSCCCLHQVAPSYVGQRKIDPPMRPSCQLKPQMRIILTSEKRGTITYLTACCRRGRVTLASGLTLAGGQKIARPGLQAKFQRVNLMRGYIQRVRKQLES